MSTQQLAVKLIQLLPLQGENLQVDQLSGGLIHQTFCVRTESDAIILQSINTQIFTDPEGLIRNHRVLHRHFQSSSAPFQLAEPLPFLDGNWIVQDDLGYNWRIGQFISDTHTLTAVNDPAQASALSEFFARFTRHAAEIQDPNWSIPIPKFHDLAHRFDQFQTALSNGIPQRIHSSRSLITDLIERKRYVAFYEQLRNNSEFRLRMMHHDAKLSNVLIDSKTGTWICPIDLDTVMPGYFFSDLGDMIRSLCNSQTEDAINPTDQEFRTDIYEALVQGYLNGMGDALTSGERTHIHLSGPIMVYMQTLRFLTDHLNGDTYYRIDRPGHNLDRALNQFNLLNQLEQYLKKTGPRNLVS